MTMINHITYRYRIDKDLNTYKGRSQRMDIRLYSRIMEQYIHKCGILPFGDITYSDHRVIYIDIRLSKYLLTPITIIADNSSRLLQINFNDSYIKN